MGRFGGLLGRDARWASPSRGHYMALGCICTLILALAGTVGHSLLGSPSPADTLAHAYDFLEAPLRLDGAQEEAWQLSVQGGGGLGSQTDALLAPASPPPLCIPGDGDATRASNRLIRSLDQAMQAGNRMDLEEDLTKLREAGGQVGRGGDAFIQFALARGLVWAGDLGSAARLLDGATLTTVEGGDVPVVAAVTASRLYRNERVSEGRVLMAFHLRYLAGVVAHSRGRPQEAIAHFRRALNAVNYVVSADSDLGSGGRFERTAMGPGPLLCGGPRGNELTSLDAYTGLVAAYMAAPDFRDPSRLAREVGRRGFEIDADDPLTPLLVHAQRVARGDGDSPIPEHVFWASSNLQRVYHYNRLRPDPRLALTRAVLTLRVLDDGTWTRALGLGEADACDMLAGVAASLHQDAAARESPTAPPPHSDSAWAAVAVHTFARLEAECPDRPTLRVGSSVRSQWLRLGGGLLHAGLVARYEALRSVLERGSGPAPEMTARDVMERVRGDQRFFHAGRVPPDMSVNLEPHMAGSFVDAWQRAIFRGVADHMLARFEGGAGPNRIRAGDASRYIRTVNAAVRHAGLQPALAYRLETLDVLARSGGSAGSMSYKAQYYARSFPHAVMVSLLLVTAAGVAVTAFLFVNWWRYSLLTRRHFFSLELGQRDRARVGLGGDGALGRGSVGDGDAQDKGAGQGSGGAS